MFLLHFFPEPNAFCLPRTAPSIPGFRRLKLLQSQGWQSAYICPVLGVSFRSSPGIQ